MILVDHLDLWSLTSLFLHSRRGTRFQFLTRAKWLDRRGAEAVLERLGHPVERLRSPFEEPGTPDNFVAFNETLVKVAVERIEPFCMRWVLGEATEEVERRRTARFLLLKCFRIARRNLEVLERGRVLRQDGEVTVYLQRSGLDAPFTAYASDHGVATRLYRAPLRFRIPARPGFLQCETDPWIGEGLARNLARSIRMILHAGLSALAAPSRRGKSGWDVPEDGVDVIAVTSRTQPSNFIDDLFWRHSLRANFDARVLLVHTSTLGEIGNRFYDQGIDGRLELGFLLRRVGVASGAPSPLLRSYFLSQLQSYRRAWHCLRAGAPMWLCVSLLGLWERTALYEALMRHTHARIAWVMTEGHELNTQAVAIAARRVGGVSLGTTWSLLESPRLAQSNNRNDVCFVWGARHVDVLRQSGALSAYFVLAGYPTKRAALSVPSHARDVADRIGCRGPTLCFYDNAVGFDLLTPEQELAKVYRTLLEIVDSNPDVQLVLKVKRDEYRAMAPEIVDRIQSLIDLGRIAMSAEPADLATGIAADIVVGTGASSLPLLAAQCGKTTVLYDPAGVTKRWYIDGGPNVHVEASPLAFKSALESVLRRARDVPARPTRVEAFIDADADIRVAQFIGDLIHAFRQGIGRTEALAATIDRYRTNWGEDKVVDNNMISPCSGNSAMKTRGRALGCTTSSPRETSDA
jgi:hypothetical protein